MLFRVDLYNRMRKLVYNYTLEEKELINVKLTASLNAGSKIQYIEILDEAGTLLALKEGEYWTKL